MDGLIYSLIFLPMAGAFVSYLVGRKHKKYRDYLVSGITFIELALASMLLFQYAANNETRTLIELPGICGMGLRFTVDGFRVIYVCIAAFMWLAASLFSMEYLAHYRNRNRYYLFWLITLGATEAIFLSADLYTTFIFFEVMSFTSYVWVAQDERAKALRAAATYLAVAVIGGLVMLMGLFLLYYQAGTLEIDKLYEACQEKDVFVASLCMLIGFGAKAGAFPLHIWLPQAHPVAPAPASALLSGVLTKTGIFGVLIISCKIFLHDGMWGTLLLALGVLTMTLGAILALFSVDFKRTLACSSVSQIGFILVGIGMQGLLGRENMLAVRGSLLHMVNHSLFKLVLFMIAGVIYMNLHKLNLNEIRGFGRKKPLLTFLYLMGAFGIGGIPLWSGYVSKTLLHESIVEYGEKLAASPERAFFFSAGNMKMIEWTFLISGGLTVAYMAKLFVAVFVEKNADAALQAKYDAQRKYMSPLSGAILTMASLLFLLMGMLPNIVMDNIADLGQSFMGLRTSGEKIVYFSFANLKGSVISIIIGMVFYLMVVRLWMVRKQEDGSSVYLNRWPHLLNLEEYFYRPVLLVILPAVCGSICGILDTAVDIFVVFLRKTIYRDCTKIGELKEGNELTRFLGRFANAICKLLNHTLWRSHPKEANYEQKFAVGYFGLWETIFIITRSLSYGLILFCIGLCITLIYLIVGAVK